MIFFAINLLQTVLAEPNITKALEKYSTKKVDYSASLGEGVNAFDPQPRMISDEVNCLTWLQAVIADSYCEEEKECQRYLDSLRYFETEISFSNRKHYVDRWLFLEPEPLVPINNSACWADLLVPITLDLPRFRRNHQYEQRLYQEEKQQFVISSLQKERMTSCINNLDNGYYVMFFVANERYLQNWGKHGTMGQVHAMILEKSERAIIHHASVDFHKVVQEDWNDLSQRLENVAQSYTIYALDPSWKAKKNMHVSSGY